MAQFCGRHMLRKHGMLWPLSSFFMIEEKLEHIRGIFFPG
jgi:hypothetical protein